MRNTHRKAYLVVTALLAVAGGVAASLGGARPAEIAVGLALAWAIQAASFWPLAGALEAGAAVAVPWVAGMGARLGGLAVLWALSALAERGGDTVLAYAFALVLFLLLEAVWLAAVTHGMPPGTEDR